MARLIFAGLMISVLSCAVWAQSTAQVSGTIKDQTGAVLPGVEVSAMQTDTGLARTAVTDETGSYVITSLPVGPYRLEATLPGFRTYVQTGIVLQVGSNPAINVVLEVGQVNDQVEVQADAALVETRSTGVGQVIDNVRVLEMPLNGRQVTELILLSGGAVPAERSQRRNYPTQTISVAGGMDNGLTYMLDGGTHNDPFNNQNLPLPFPDALQEFKVETSAVPAQYGYHSGGAVNAVTKSGTNEFHGDLFEFVRNKVFNARNAFAVTRDGLKRNQFGGTLGGPLVKNKLFFFGGYQGTIQRSEPTEQRAYLATQAMLAGDWTAIASPACNAGRQIALNAPFVNNRIDPSLLARPALNFMKLLPTPTDPCGEILYGLKANQDEKFVVGKVDYQGSEKHSIFGRYLLARLNLPSDYDGATLLSATQSDTLMQVPSFAFGDTYLIGDGTVSSFRATVNRTLVKRTAPADFYDWSDLGVRGVYILPNYPKIGRMSVPGGFSTFGNALPGFANSTVFQFAEDLSTVRGAHQLGFGANYINTRMNLGGNAQASGMFTFGSQQTRLGLGDFMLGKASRFSQTRDTPPMYMRQPYIGLYLQDTWRANSRLTVNAGVRWEPYLPVWEKGLKVFHFDKARFDQGIRSTVYKNAPPGLLFPGDAGVPANGAISSAHWLHFAPRVGLAWDPSGDGRMTVRTAYGVLFDLSHLWQFQGFKDGSPWGYQLTIPDPPGGFEDPWRGYPGGNPFPVELNPNIAFPVAGTYLTVPPELKGSYVNQWNLSVQRQLGTDWLVSGNYLGSNVIHMLDSVEANPAVYMPGSSCVIHGTTFTPCSTTANTHQRRELYLKNPSQGQYYGFIMLADDGGTRSYNAMLLSLQRRRTQGLTVQANYTWSHCIDDGTKDGNFNPNTGGQEVPERRKLNRGNCETDRRHIFNLSTVYETPQFANTTLRTLGSGWRFSGIVRLQSGQYLIVTSGLDNALSGTSDQRPDQVLPDVYTSSKSPSQYLNPAAFQQPALGAYGNLGNRNVLGPGRIQLDMGLSRSFRIRENHSVEFRAEAFNVPNHLNPGNPVTALNNARFGQIQTASDPRIMQLALKYVF